MYITTGPVALLHGTFIIWQVEVRCLSTIHTRAGPLDIICCNLTLHNSPIQFASGPVAFERNIRQEKSGVKVLFMLM